MERGKRNINDTFFGQTPVARAVLNGSALAPEITGVAQFYPYREGTLVVVEVSGLPEHIPAILDKPPIGPFGFHIHEGGTCGVTTGDQPFQTAGAHYNPTQKHHPEHAGDLPVLFSNDGYAWMAVYTNRFRPEEVVGRTVMIHQNPDDFRSQPAGNSGVRIACGVIERLK